MRELPKRKRTPERQEFYDFMLKYKDKGQDLDEDEGFYRHIFSAAYCAVCPWDYIFVGAIKSGENKLEIL